MYKQIRGIMTRYSRYIGYVMGFVFSSSDFIYDDDFYVSNRGVSRDDSINEDELYCDG